MPRVIHFEISSKNPGRLSDFYREVFDWQVHPWADSQNYWSVTTGEEGEEGINGGIIERSKESQGVVHFIDVPDLDAYLEKVEQAGGKLLSKKAPIKGVGYLAYCRDLEENTFALIQFDPRVS